MGTSEFLILLILLAIKHMFADYFLQTQQMLMDRGKYVHGGRALHCLVHVAATALCLAALGIPFTVIIAVILAEWVLHFHIDYFKALWSMRAAHKPQDAAYWRAFGIDQTLHQLTYIGIAWSLM